MDNRNWKLYSEYLIRRGEFYFNPIFLDTWDEELTHLNRHKIGQPYKYPTSLIEFLAVLKSRGFDYRSLQGIVRSLSMMFGIFPVISFSQIRRRILALPLLFNSKCYDSIVGVDGTGFKVSNRGEWMRQKWKVRRGWIKVVLLGDRKGNVVDVRIGNEQLDERASGRGMLRNHRKSIDKVLMDGYHDCVDTFDLCKTLKIESGIKIRKNASENGFGRRPSEVRLYKELGYEDWAKEKDYGLRWPATEGIFSAVKRMFGENVMSHRKRAMYHEAKLKFWVYQLIRDV